MYQEATFRWQFMSLLFLPLIFSLFHLSPSLSLSLFHPLSLIIFLLPLSLLCDCHLIFTTISDSATTRISYILSHVFFAFSHDVQIQKRKGKMSHISFYLFLQHSFCIFCFLSHDTIFSLAFFSLSLSLSVSLSLSLFSLSLSLSLLLTH